MKQEMKSVLILCFLLLSTVNFAQQNGCERKINSGKCTIVPINEFMEPQMYKSIMGGIKKSSLQGFRIQIYASTNRYSANKVKFNFEDNKYNLPVYLVYESPEFKIRVGDFRNKLEACKLLSELQEQFKSASLVPDKINFPKIELQ